MKYRLTDKEWIKYHNKIFDAAYDAVTCSDFNTLMSYCKFDDDCKVISYDESSEDFYDAYNNVMYHIVEIYWDHDNKAEDIMCDIYDDPLQSGGEELINLYSASGAVEAFGDKIIKCINLLDKIGY